MKWKEILLKALDYIKKYRALWYLGILAAMTEGGAGANFSGLNNSASNSGGLSDSMQSSMDSVFNWISNNRLEVGIILFGFFLISLVILYISYSARAGLIHSINKAESGDKKPEFHQAFHAGQKYFWQFLGLTLLVSLMVFAVVFVLIGVIATFVILVASVSLWFLIIAIPVGLLLILGIVVLAIYLNWIMLLAYREIVIGNKKIVASISAARELIHHNFMNIVLAWLIQTAVGVVVGIVMAIVTLAVGGILFAIGVGLYFAGGISATLVYGAFAALIFVALTLVLAGIVNSYYSTYWTIVYRKLVESS